MKHIVRALVVALTLTGAVASTYANTSSASTKATTSQQSATARMPIPACVPGLPGCGRD